jgi:UDP-3-O-[3-hydroxymyristoyl] glucosamine N-acyltransferase
MKRTIKNPHWINNARTVLSAEFHYDDGRVVTAVINSNESNNVDYQEIRTKYTAEQLEQNTAAMIKKQNQAQEAKKAQEEAMRDKERQERLFAVKLQAFDVDAIKNTTNKTLKSSLRRAKSDFEVYAYAAAIILDAVQNPPAEEAPSE